jgi:hypothetical protein
MRVGIRDGETAAAARAAVVAVSHSVSVPRVHGALRVGVSAELRDAVGLNGGKQGGRKSQRGKGARACERVSVRGGKA